MYRLNFYQKNQKSGFNDMEDRLQTLSFIAEEKENNKE